MHTFPVLSCLLALSFQHSAIQQNLAPSQIKWGRFFFSSFIQFHVCAPLSVALMFWLTAYSHCRTICGISQFWFYFLYVSLSHRNWEMPCLCLTVLCKCSHQENCFVYPGFVSYNIRFEVARLVEVALRFRMCILICCFRYEVLKCVYKINFFFVD